jgi:hypothetical protein
MGNKGVFTKILAVLGTVLVWFPLLAPMAFSAVRLIRGGIFLFDYLMPAELFPSALAGGALLFLAAFRAKARISVIGWGLGSAVFLLVGSQALAVVTGLASSVTDPTGWVYAVVLAALIAFVLAFLLVVGVGGVLLLRDVFKVQIAK